ncbi:probable calcium-binding protein CML49 [Phalaenopsis equestris]|uniref:probable calcium-binding protein CML49 n=1 Tax=Phalaenopsis equestris TaxID=78828 RepID=UPI0009E23BBF|nr:probable calcium-binding protein CML49 [Phalaenopsis equestris]
MAGYPQGSGNPYGAPPANPYGSAPPQPYGAAPPQSYGAAPTQPHGYGAPQPSAPYSKPEKPGKIHGGGGAGGYDSQPYGYGAPQPSEPYYKPEKPGKTHGVGGGVGYEQPPPAAGYGAATPFAALLPSQFPPGTDPSLVACFQIADQDGSGLIDDKELQRALSSYNQGFSLRTVHLLMYLFTSSNIRKIGPKEFTSLFYSLQNWRAIFERFDRDRSGRIDAPELREALLSLGYAVSPVVLDLLLAKFDKSDGKYRAIEYDNFIECCLTVKGLTDKFKEKDTTYTGSATFTYESFMLTVLPFLIA